MTHIPFNRPSIVGRKLEYLQEAIANSHLSGDQSCSRRCSAFWKRPSDILAGFLCAQLEAWKKVQSVRGRVWHYYYHNLRDWADENRVQLPTVPDYCEHPNHLFYILLPTLEQRQDFMAYLKAHDMASAFHYLPLHLSDTGRRSGGKPGDCPVTEQISDRLARLPFHNSLTEVDLERVVGLVRQFRVAG